MNKDQEIEIHLGIAQWEWVFRILNLSRCGGRCSRCVRTVLGRAVRVDAAVAAADGGG
jgi:hypothetical protein